ncbi:MAG: LacI family DNA-binding transcriptional regulator [Firmicutes bacterium]|nr:LacI family DNA-binding transcriptional regulator [Bacillota bacterium]
MAATYKDIQRLTGLSLATISKYFNGGAVRAENRQAIEEAIQQLDFHVNAYARSLKSKRSRLIGGLIPELDSTFNTRMMADVEESLRQQGYGLIICDSRLDQDSEKEALDFLLGRMVDGIITIPYDKSGQHLEAAHTRGVPVVVLDRLPTDFETDAVVLENADAARAAAETFIRNGHKDIAIINGPGSLFTMRERMRGFQETLAAHKIPIRPEWMIDGPMTIDGGYQNTKMIMSLWHRPTALFCANYEITFGAMIALNEMGIRIPEEISMIGFDNLPLARVIKPRLTMVMQPMEELAHKAAELLIDRIEENAPQTPQIIRMQAELVEGESVKSLN